MSRLRQPQQNEHCADFILVIFAVAIQRIITDKPLLEAVVGGSAEAYRRSSKSN